MSQSDIEKRNDMRCGIREREKKLRKKKITERSDGGIQ
jgi:hypothetical protein